MPNPTPEECDQREKARRRIEVHLTQWEMDDFILPGWQILWNPERKGFVTTFHMNHETLPYEMGETEFSAYARGFTDRRRAVMARRPKAETVKQRPKELFVTP